MTYPAPPPSGTGSPVEHRSRRGRGLIISGAVLLVVSVVAGVVAAVVFFAGLDVGQFTREVSISGASDRLVPGEIPFRIGDADGRGELRVAIVLSEVPSPAPQCSIVDGDRTIELGPVGMDDELYDLSGRYDDYVMVGTATLEPGEYEARCVAGGEPSAAVPVSFTVGRVLGFAEFEGFFGSFLWSAGIGSLASIVFIVGLVLLIVGLVQRSKRPSEPSGPFAGPPGSAPMGPYTGAPGSAPMGWSQPPGPYGQPGPSQQPGPYQQPDPYQPPAPPEWTPAPAPSPEPPDDGHSGWTVPPSKH